MGELADPGILMPLAFILVGVIVLALIKAWKGAR